MLSVVPSRTIRESAVGFGKARLIVSWHFSAEGTFVLKLGWGRSPSAIKIGLLLKMLDESRWRCISPACRLLLNFRTFFVPNSSRRASDFDLLPINTKRLGFCVSGSCKWLVSVWSLSDSRREVSLLYVPKLSQWLWLQRFMVDEAARCWEWRCCTFVWDRERKELYKKKRGCRNELLGEAKLGSG